MASEWPSERVIPHAGVGNFATPDELLREIIQRIKLLDERIDRLERWTLGTVKE